MNILKSKWLRRGLLVSAGLFLTLLLYGLLQLIEPVKISPIAPDAAVKFTGQALLVASDADMVATAYADAKLDRVPDIEDELTLVELPLNAEQPKIASIPVSNSVMSWPQIIAISPDGQRAYVVEVRSRPDDGINEFDDIDQMPPGSQLAIVDISERSQPRLMESVTVGCNPEHISISPNGELLAVNLNEPGKELMIVALQPDGRLGKRLYFPMELDGTREDNQTVIWHPSGRYLAIVQDRNRRVSFYQVNRDEGEISVQSLRPPLEIGNHLSHPRFTKNGRFLLVPDLKWSLYQHQTLNFLLNQPGEMIAVQFEPEAENPARVASRVDVGLSPEGFSLSPDDTLLVTVNMRRTYLPDFLPAWRGKPYTVPYLSFS